MTMELTIRAADGYQLGAIEYPPHGQERGRLVVASATAVGQTFYRRFGEHAAARGYRVTTFDYRGVGRSAPATLAGFDCSFTDWGRLDLAAVIDAVHTPGLPLLLVGHSFGGHALGMLPNHALVDAAWLFGTGSGWHGWMPPLERLRVLFLWHVAGPLLVRRHGYLAWRRLGMGEDLPIGVYRQWKHWCRFPGFFLDDPEAGAIVENLACVRTPIVAMNSLDDRWSSPAARDALLAGYTGASWRGIDVDHLRLGHMGYFRPHAQELWDTALDWFDALPRRSAAAR